MIFAVVWFTFWEAGGAHDIRGDITWGLKAPKITGYLTVCTKNFSGAAAKETKKIRITGPF